MKKNDELANHAERFSHGVKQLTPIAVRAIRTAGASVALLLLSVSVAYAQSSGLENPLKFNDIQSFIAGALKALVVIALPIITLFIVYSGFLFVAARGNESKLTDAKKNFVYVIIGTLLILGAWVLATLIGGTVTQVLGQ